MEVAANRLTGEARTAPVLDRVELWLARRLLLRVRPRCGTRLVAAAAAPTLAFIAE